MANGEENVTVYRPPVKLYKFWTGHQGPVSLDSRKSAQKQEREEAKAERQDTTDFIAEYIQFQRY